MQTLTAKPTPLTPVAGADVVFTFSYISWRAAERRGFSFAEDRLVQSLIADTRVGRLIVGDTLRRLPAKLVRDGLKPGATTFPADVRRRLVSPTRLGPAQPTSKRGARRAVAAYELALSKAAHEMEMVEPAVITANPLVAGLGDFGWARSVTYYGFDDFLRLPMHRQFWPLFEVSYEQIRARKRRVGAVSPGLRAELAPPDRSVLVPNGLEPSEWVGEPSPPAFAASLPRPICLYVGTIDYRLRVDWLSALARAMPSATVVLVGPPGDELQADELRRIDNVVLHPAIEDRRAFAGLIRHADVGLIPHHRTPLTETIEPQKVWEYLAGGLPVVSTDLPPVRGIDPRVTLVPDDGDFPAAVQLALAGDRAPESERSKFVDANSWRARHDGLIELALS